MKTVRRLISEVLDKKLAGGCFSRATAERLARRILHENAREFSSFGITKMSCFENYAARRWKAVASGAKFA